MQHVHDDVMRCSSLIMLLTFCTSPLQPWEHSGKPFKGFARVTPVSVEEMMESEPFGLEVSVMVALAVF
jgi:hypothetical protein